MDMPANAKTQTISGKKYVFIDTPYWNAEKHRGEHKRRYIGKIVEGQFVPNGKYLLSLEKSGTIKPGPVPVTECKRQFYGATYLLDQIGDKLGIVDDLKASFPDKYKQLLSLAYFFVLEEGMSAYRLRKWALTHKHPYGRDISSQRISELMGSIDEASKMNFFRRQARRRAEKEFLAFDTTSISSYSELIKFAKYGKNKEGDHLPQINLALLYGEVSRLPVYFRKLTGNTADVSLIRNLMLDIDFLDMKKLSFVMDRGFYSEKNINDLMKHHHKFLIGIRRGLKITRKHLDEVRGEKLISWENYHDDVGLYAMSFSDEWDYREEQPRTGKCICDKRRVYVHVYFNDQRCTDERLSFAKYLTCLQDELKSGRRTERHLKDYDKYFVVSETPKKGLHIVPNGDAIREHQRDFGYFVLLSNGIKDPEEAITLYRVRDLIEKAFANLKERLDMRRMSVSSSENFEGKLFVQFLALIYLSYIKKQMDEKGLYKKYTMQTLLDDLDIIELYQQPGRAHHLSEITKKQMALYDAMGVPFPK